MFAKTGRVILKCATAPVDYVRGYPRPAEQEVSVLTRKPKASLSEAVRRRTFSSDSIDIIATYGTAIAALLLVFGLDVSWAQASKRLAASASATLSPVDYNFAAQANLGAPFQIDSGRIAEKGATAVEIRNYAHLMVVTHIPVVDALNKILARKNIEAPSN